MLQIGWKFSTKISGLLFYNVAFCQNSSKYKEDVDRGHSSSLVLFLICGGILAIFMNHNFYIRSIIANGNEHNISLYADDTTLITDGSPISLFAALDTLDFLYI